MTDLTENRLEFMAECMEMRISGWSYDAMARHFKCARPLVMAAVKEGLAQSVTELAEEVRHIELDRLDAMILSHWEHRGNPRHADVILKVMDRRAKFLGLDIPQVDPNDAAGALREFLRAAGASIGAETARADEVPDAAPGLDASEEM